MVGVPVPQRQNLIPIIPHDERISSDNRKANLHSMTPAQFKTIRQRVGLSQSGLARALRVEDVRTIRRYETGERAISGPVTLLMELIDAGLIPPPIH